MKRHLTDKAPSSNTHSFKPEVLSSSGPTCQMRGTEPIHGPDQAQRSPPAHMPDPALAALTQADPGRWPEWVLYILDTVQGDGPAHQEV